MIVTLSERGKVVITVTILLILLAVFIRSPPLILFASLLCSYIVAYPLLMRRKSEPNLDLEVNLRHGVVFRGEVDILQIIIRNNTSEVIPLTKLRITLPYSIYAVEKPIEYKFTFEPKMMKRINLPILASERGEFDIGPIEFYVEDPFEVYQNLTNSVNSVPIKVFPQRLGRHVSKSRSQHVFSKLIGLFATAQRGIGTDFHGLREYIRGDPSKIVDWKATARANKLISKEFEEERKLEVLIAFASGTTTRGKKFDYMLGIAMDIYEGFINEGKPAGLVLFDDDIIIDYLPSPSNRRKMKIWERLYSLQPKDVYADYHKLDQWIDKNGITNTLIFILGDLEGDFQEISNNIRNIRLRGNDVIFIDVWGYPFSYEQELYDTSIAASGEDYGVVLEKIIGRGIKQYNIFRGLKIKKELARNRIIYGYLNGPGDNVIDAIDRAMYSFYGDEWKVTK